MSAGFEDAVHLTQAFVQVAEVTTAESAGDGIKRGVFKGHGLGIGMHKLDIGYWRLEIGDFLLTDGHHLVGEVDTCDLFGLVLTKHLNGEIGGTDGDIKHVLSGCHAGDGFATPETVNIERQTMVESVVGTGNAVKELSYMLFFFHFGCKNTIFF